MRGSFFTHFELVNERYWHKYTSYTSAFLKMKKISKRRGQLCLKFALKCEKHPKFKKWFKPTEKIVRTRTKPSKYIKPFATTRRFEKSPLPYLTNLLNLHYNKKWSRKNSHNFIVTVNYRGIGKWVWWHCYYLSVPYPVQPYH